jgi:predicted dehydrogenase
VMLPDSDEILEWCDRLVNTCRETGRRYMLGETTCYKPETMYCRRQAADKGFGEYLHADGHYMHDVDVPGCSLRDVRAHRYASRAGKEWKQKEKSYQARGIVCGPMHYPTHSVSGPLSVMRTHGLKVTAKGFAGPADDSFFDHEMSNETAFFHLANGATMRICEYRLIGHPGEETFQLFGTRGAYREDQWVTKDGKNPLSVDEMRDPLPSEVMDAFSAQIGKEGVYGGHGGSHPHLVHEFVSSIAEDRQPAINAWEAVRYMACGATAHKSALADGEMLSIPDWGDAPVS